MGTKWRWSIRISITRAPRAKVSYPPAAGAVLVGSRASHVAMRADLKPEVRPARNGELAKEATRAGPAAWASAHRRARAAGGPRPMFTWSAAVLHIIVRPSALTASKYASIARYRGPSTSRCGSRTGSVPEATRRTPAGDRARVMAARSAVRARVAVGASGLAGGL